MPYSFFFQTLGASAIDTGIKQVGGKNSREGLPSSVVARSKSWLLFLPHISIRPNIRGLPSLPPAPPLFIETLSSWPCHPFPPSITLSLSLDSPNPFPSSNFIGPISSPLVFIFLFSCVAVKRVRRKERGGEGEDGEAEKVHWEN